MKFAFIQELDEEEQRKSRTERIPVSLMCEVLVVSRSGFYAWANRNEYSASWEPLNIASGSQGYCR